jgi:hypothetical protein
MRCWSTITRLGGGGALALALLTGCAGDATVTDPAIALPTLSRDSLRPSFTIAPPLEITPANEQRCESRTVEREPGGRFVRWRASQREQVTVARAAADTVLTRYEAYAFDRTGAQTAEAQCILRRGTNAKQFMRGFFERPGRGGLVGVLAEATAAPVPPGIPPVFIGVGTVCLFDVWSWQMQCGNTTCYPMFAARAPTGAVRFGLAEDTATRVGGPTARLIGGWECPGVGHLSLNGNGTLTLHPNGGGGGGSGGGGGCGGGGGGSGGDSSGDGSVNPPGGGGGATSWWGASCDTLPPPYECLAKRDSACLLPLTSADSLRLDSLRVLFRETSTIADSAAKVECAFALAAFAQAWPSKFRRGRFDTPPDSGEHWAEAYQGLIHIEPRWLDSSLTTSDKKELARTLLHEALHVAGKRHGLNGNPDYPSFPYFRFVESYDSATSCVQL